MLLTLFRNSKRQIFSVLMKWDSKHVRQKHFRFYVPPICRVLPKHNAQRPSKEGRDWTFIWIEQKALSGLQNCVHIYIHKRHDRSLRELFLVYQQCLANIYTNSGYIYDLCHWSITGIEFVKKHVLTCKALFPWFPILWKALKESISPSWFQEPKQGNILLFK